MMKYIYPITIIILLSYIFVQQSCSQPNIVQKKEVIIPEKKGEFKKLVVQINHKQKDSIVFRKGQTIYTENPINKQLAEEFIKLQKENDSLGLIKKYVEAVQIRKQTTVFDDKDITIEIDTEVQGELRSILPKWKVKEYKTKIDVPLRFRPAVYVGAGLSDNKQFNNTTLELQLGLKLKNDIFLISGDSRQNFGIKYLKKL